MENECDDAEMFLKLMVLEMTIKKEEPYENDGGACFSKRQIFSYAAVTIPAKKNCLDKLIVRFRGDTRESFVFARVCFPFLPEN